MDSEGASAGKKESCRNPTNWSLLATYQKKLPLQMKNRTGPTINARFWDRIYQWIYRHNMSKWDIASRCEMNKKVSANFSSSLDEIADLKNDKTWGVLTRWCQKTHGCVNPCYHVFGLPIRQKRMTHPAFQRQPSPGLIGQSMGQSDLALTVISPLPSGRHTKNYWTWPFIVDLPIKNGDFP